MIKNNNFYGKIDGENCYDFLKKLDNTIKTSEERIEYVNKFLSKYNFFNKYFDYYYKVNINTDENQFYESNICKCLEVISYYITSAPSKKERTKSNIINNRKLYNIEKSEHPFDIEKIENSTSNYQTLVSDNYYLENNPVIEKKDYHPTNELEKILLDTLNQIDDTIKNFRLIKKNNKKLTQGCNKAINELNQERVFAKLAYKRIFSTHTYSSYHEKTELLDKYDFGNPEHILQLVKMGKNDYAGEPYRILLYDLEELFNRTKLTNCEESVLAYLYEYNMPTSEIAKYFKVNKKKILSTIKSATKKMAQQYEDECFDDFVEKLFSMFKPKENIYKRCSKCGEYKLKYHFGKDSTRIDGLKPMCKMCRNV